MTIDGNAYTNSFIRTGKYSNDPASGGSRIDISKDAAALCVQVFGKGDKIVLHKDAYTFDDLEMDGEDSVIAVNGNYYGLNFGDGTHHDNSSAVLNAAPVHWMYSDDSMRSRIVINGDVLINGGAYKIKPDTGETLFELENASMAWKRDSTGSYKSFIPCYKDFTGTTEGYKDFLVKNKANTGGFLNLFQLWTPYQADVETWLSQIDTIRHNNTDPTINDYFKFGLDSKIPPKITGYASYEMAANDTIYDMQDTVSASYISEMLHESLYSPDIFKDVNTGVNSHQNWWDDFKNISSSDPFEWQSKYWSAAPGTNTVSGSLQILGNDLYRSISQFAYRDYPIDYDGTAVTTDPDIKSKLKSLFYTWRDTLKKRYGTSGINPNAHILYYTTTGVSDIDIFKDIDDEVKKPGATISHSDYYLVVNESPEKTIVVSNQFNGIIFTTGCVKVSPGATVNGSIIAAGRGCKLDPVNKTWTLDGSSSDYDDITTLNPTRLPIVTDYDRNDPSQSNVGELDAGNYAGVRFEPGGSSTVTFTNRTDLMTNMDASGIHVRDIF